MALNIPNIKRVRDVIAGLPDERFDMRDFYRVDGEGMSLSATHKSAAEVVHGCGTAACVAGWAAAVLAPAARCYADTEARREMGLTDQQASELFMPDGFCDPGRYTRAQAVAVLDRLIETGEVSWSDAPSRGQPATPTGRAGAPGDDA